MKKWLCHFNVILSLGQNLKSHYVHCYYTTPAIDWQRQLCHTREPKGNKERFSMTHTGNERETRSTSP